MSSVLIFVTREMKTCLGATETLAEELAGVGAEAATGGVLFRLPDGTGVEVEDGRITLRGPVNRDLANAIFRAAQREGSLIVGEHTDAFLRVAGVSATPPENLLPLVDVVDGEALYSVLGGI